MSIQRLLNDEPKTKGWANLYVNTLTAYNGIFGTIQGDNVVENLHVNGTLRVDDEAKFFGDLDVESTLGVTGKIYSTTGEILKTNGGDDPWFVRQQDVQNGDGGSVPTGLMVSDDSQSGYKQLKTYESADGGYAHYGGEDNRIITYHTANDIIDEGIQEEGLVAKSAGGITSRGLVPQDFHQSALFTNAGVLRSVYNVDEARFELRVDKTELANILVPEGTPDRSIITFNETTGQLQYETYPTIPAASRPSYSFQFSRRPADYTVTTQQDIYLGGLSSANAFNSDVASNIVDDPSCQLRVFDGTTGEPAAGVFPGFSDPPTAIYYTVTNTVNPAASDRFLVRADIYLQGATVPAFLEVRNTTGNYQWMLYDDQDLSGNFKQVTLQGVFKGGDRFRFLASLQSSLGTASGLRILTVDTHITKIA